jgi:hypothetical protein
VIFSKAWTAAVVFSTVCVWLDGKRISFEFNFNFNFKLGRGHWLGWREDLSCKDRLGEKPQFRIANSEFKFKLG